MAIVAGSCVTYVVRSPSVILLSDSASASWLRSPAPLWPFVKPAGQQRMSYRTTLIYPMASPSMRVNVTALRSCRVFFDDVELQPDGPPPQNWKLPSSFPLAPHPDDGPHRLQVDVINTTGPPLVRVELSPPLPRQPAWECSVDGLKWTPAAKAIDPEPLAMDAGLSPTPAQAVALWPLPAGLLIVSMFAMHAAARPMPPNRLRLLLIALWLLLAGVDMGSVPVAYGFDLVPHLQYLDFILARHRLPLGTEGWQLFQAPLFYLVASPLWLLLKTCSSQDRAAVLLRVVPISCGCVMIELVYRTLRGVFPARVDLQRVGLVVGGLLPVNLYMMQFPSNEPFMAVFGAATAWSVCRWLAHPNLDRPWRPALVTGLLLGLAVLSKVSAIVWIAPVIITYASPFVGQAKPWRRVFACTATIVAAVALVSGWWFLRNQLEMGVPLLTHSGGNWWQDPGYRTPRDLLLFGDSLLRPIITGARGVWDSLYSSFWADAFGSGVIDPHVPPPWNLRVMLLAEWFALLPTGLMAWAIAAPVLVDRLKLPAHRSVQFAAISIACFTAAVVHVYLTLPIYSCAKASYMMGATPCFAILIAAGFDRIPTPARRFVSAMLLSGAALAYASFFVLP